MPETATRPQAAIRDELESILSDVGADDPAEAAEFLVSNDSRNRVLVGLAGDSRPLAIEWDPSLDSLNGFPADADLRGVASERIGRLDSLGCVERWVAEQGRDHWLWLHPRSRWVFDIVD
jgi:hypothetical protein